MILGTGNGNPNSHESDKMPERDLFAGWCQVLVQTASGANALTLLVSTKGFEMAALKFEIRKSPCADNQYWRHDEQFNV